MKKTTILFVILYLVIFVSVSWWAYNKYFRNTSAISGETQTISFNKNKTIFYTIENNLYLLNSDNLNKSTNQIGTLRLQSTGEVQTINFDQKNEFIVYSSINPQNASEIWKVDLADNHSEKIFAKEIPGFENYTNFRSPKMSNTERFMVFIAKLSANSGVDDIFLWDIEQNSIENLTKQTIKSKISAICWSGSEQKIYYAAEDTTGSLVSLMDLKAINQNVFVSPDKITRMEATRDRLILSLQDANLTTNLSYILYAKPQSIIPITDLASPKTLVNFDLSSDFKKIIYQVNDSNLKTNDLYLVNSDGNNLLQLSTDGKSYFGVFSPENDKIAFWSNGSGIYTEGLTKDNKQKLLNESKLINKIIIWR